MIFCHSVNEAFDNGRTTFILFCQHYNLPTSAVGLGSFIVPDFWVALVLPTAKPLKCQYYRVLDLVRFFPFQLYPLLELSEYALALCYSWDPCFLIKML